MNRAQRFIERIPDVIWILATVALLLVLSAVKTAHAQSDVDLRAGFSSDPDAVSLGAGILTPLSHQPSWYFNPNVEFAFPETSTEMSFNADFHYDLSKRPTSSFWFGGGPALLITDRGRADTDVDLGINMLAGVGGTRGQVRPFGQVKGTVANDSRVAIMGGVRF